MKTVSIRVTLKSSKEYNTDGVAEADFDFQEASASQDIQNTLNTLNESGLFSDISWIYL